MPEAAKQNTDRELWRESTLRFTGGGHYENSIHVTETGGIGINCGGHVIVMTLGKWHQAAIENEKMKEAKMLCAAQAEDDGLWFEAETAPEGYLQQELRRLHTLIEGDKKPKISL